MKQKKLKITLEDFIIANRKAARMEEIERHGRQVLSRKMVHKSKKTYDRNRLKRAVIKNDDSSFNFIYSPDIRNTNLVIKNVLRICSRSHPKN